MPEQKLIKSRILQRIDDEQNWTSVNPILSSAEIVFSRTQNGTFMKLGDGRHYNDTPFYQDIKIDENKISSLNFVHISKEDYAQLVVTSAINESTIYFLSGDLDAYGRQIKNIADGTDLSDAVNLRQLRSAISAENMWEAGDEVDSAKRKITTATPVVTGSESTVISQGALTTGVACVAGLKGYRYTNTGNVTNSLTFATAPTGWAAGDVVSIVNSEKYENCATIASISETTVTFTENLPFASIEDDDGWDAKLVYVSEKPTVGDVEIGYGAYAEGLGTNALNIATHAEGLGTKALGHYAHAEGRETIAQYAAHAEGYGTRAIEEQAHSEGYYTTASGKHSHVEGCRTQATKSCAHSEGENTIASGNQSHSEGYNTTASASQTHAEGNSTKAIANQAHAEGNSTTASGTQSHAEGYNTTSGGGHSHSEGSWTNAGGSFSHAEGRYTKTQNAAEHAEGQFNKSNKANTTFGNAGNTIHSIGIGTAEANRKNAVEVTQNGNVYVISVGGYNGNSLQGKTLQATLSEISGNFQNYYNQSETSSSQQLKTEFDKLSSKVETSSLTNYMKLSSDQIQGLSSTVEIRDGSSIDFESGSELNVDTGAQINMRSGASLNFLNSHSNAVVGDWSQISVRNSDRNLCIELGLKADLSAIHGDYITNGESTISANRAWSETRGYVWTVTISLGTYVLSCNEDGTSTWDQCELLEDGEGYEFWGRTIGCYEDDILFFKLEYDIEGAVFHLTMKDKRDSQQTYEYTLVLDAPLIQYLPHGPFGNWDAIVSYMPWTKTGILTTKDYVDEAISGKADLSAIPSNTSQLSNDSSFITSADISSKADISSVPKISVDGEIGDFGLMHVSRQEYEQILQDGPLSNVLYLVSSEYNNAYGMQIKNLSAGTDLSDAVNLEQLNQLSAQLNQVSSSIFQYFNGVVGNLESLINSL